MLLKFALTYFSSLRYISLRDSVEENSQLYSSLRELGFRKSDERSFTMTLKGSHSKHRVTVYLRDTIVDLRLPPPSLRDVLDVPTKARIICGLCDCSNGDQQMKRKVETLKYFVKEKLYFVPRKMESSVSFFNCEPSMVKRVLPEFDIVAVEVEDDVLLDREYLESLSPLFGMTPSISFAATDTNFQLLMACEDILPFEIQLGKLHPLHRARKLLEITMPARLGEDGIILTRKEEWADSWQKFRDLIQRKQSILLFFYSSSSSSSSSHSSHFADGDSADGGADGDDGDDDDSVVSPPQRYKRKSRRDGGDGAVVGDDGDGADDDHVSPPRRHTLVAKKRKVSRRSDDDGDGADDGDDDDDGADDGDDDGDGADDGDGSNDGGSNDGDGNGPLSRNVLLLGMWDNHFQQKGESDPSYGQWFRDGQRIQRLSEMGGFAVHTMDDKHSPEDGTLS
jgi:hypothetical protein